MLNISINYARKQIFIRAFLQIALVELYRVGSILLF